MSTRSILHAALAAGLLGLGAAGALWILGTRPEAPEAELPGPRPVPVSTAVLSPREVPRDLDGVGTLEPWREAVLASEIGGRVTAVLEGLRDGVLVPEGATLLEVDSAAIRAELAARERAIELAAVRRDAAESERARAEIALLIAREAQQLAAADEVRWQGLVERERAEQLRLDTAKGRRLQADLDVQAALTRVEAAEASRRAAEVERSLAIEERRVLEDRLARTVLIAPFEGRFVAQGGRTPTVGSTLAPLAPVGRLADVSRMRVASEVHEDDLDALRPGVQAAAAPGSRPGVVLHGSVTSIGAEVDPLTRSVRVESTFQGAVERPVDLPIGTFARVELAGQPLQDALWIDDRWIGFRDGRAVVFVLEGRAPAGGGRVSARPIEFRGGLFDGGRVVVSGLRAGDEIVTSSLELLGDGAAVVRESRGDAR